MKRMEGLLFLALSGLAAAIAPAAAEEPHALSAVARLGKAMFFDPSLSASGAMSCASCHDPGHRYAPPNNLTVQLGGPDMDRPGIRTTPTLTYKALTPAFSMGEPAGSLETDDLTPMDEVAAKGRVAGLAPTTPVGTAARVAKAAIAAGTAAAAADTVPQGGMFWDGRADSLEDQTMGPLMSPFEMANGDTHDLYEKVRAGYGEAIARFFGEQVLHDERMTIDEAGFALARFQTEDPSFHSFDSKYDFYLRGAVQLTPAEARGLKLFDDPKKGNCASCHIDRPGADGAPPVFTDYEFEALGVPRNPAIPANGDPHYFDLGICGPMRSDSYSREARNCGLFKTPTLRNVATRPVFFHNGVFHSLEDVLHFYVERDTDPGRFYPKGVDGKVEKYNDLPARYRANIDTIDAPLDRKPGDRPALDDGEIEDVIAFLKTLTDGYRR